MPKLFAIRPIRYPARDLSTKIAPPYDVLDEGPKRQLLARDPHNIVAIDLPVTPPKTVGPDQAYEQAGATFRHWLAQGVLVQDEKPSLFAYEQAYEVGGIVHRRRGLFANLEVEDFNRPGGGIFRHEHTIRGGTDDRLKLMRATAAQLSPVFGVYEDPAGEIRSLFDRFFDASPDATGTTATDGVEHRLWRIDDPVIVQALGRRFADVNVFIADGHHRYTTALNYHRENCQNTAAGSCLFVLVATQDPGLNVLATHRVLHGMQDFTFEKLRKTIEEDGRFSLTPVPNWNLHERMRQLRPFTAALYNPETKATFLLTALDEDPLRDIAPDQPPVWRRLDVAILHELFVDRLVRPHFGGSAVTYKYYGDEEDFHRDWLGSGGLGVLMRPTPLESVIEVSLAGGVMPPKSTFFFPKLATGLVINPLHHV